MHWKYSSHGLAVGYQLWYDLTQETGFKEERHIYSEMHF
jgi:hypothetical protein